MKVICQNCFTVLAERNDKEDYLRFDPNAVNTVFQEMNKDETLITFVCPTCDCMV